MIKKVNLKNLTLAELGDHVEAMGERRFRAKQIYHSLYKGCNSVDKIAGLPAEFKKKAQAVWHTGSLEILEKQESQKDGTVKYLFGLRDGHTVESVFMKYKHGNSVCISSQVGCRMGCKFCASGLSGIVRNLSAGEMIGQIVEIEKDTKRKVTNIVVMGTGEPFDNYTGVSKFLQIANEPEGLRVGMRNMTVSTCGLVPKIPEFARDFPQVNLAVSLHAPNDEIRNKTMPINKKYPIAEVIEACKEYIELCNRRVTFEYALVKGLNDSEENILELAKLLSGMLCHVNLIPLNSVDEIGMEGSDRQRAKELKNLLGSRGITTTVRRELGTDIDGACGQLRAKAKRAVAE